LDFIEMPGIEGLPRLLRCCDRRDRSCDLPPGKVLLIMTVEIGNGQSDSIKVYPNDQPLQLAKDFCAKARSFASSPSARSACRV
jgi:hypothetical protein